MRHTAGFESFAGSDKVKRYEEDVANLAKSGEARPASGHAFGSRIHRETGLRLNIFSLNTII